MTKPTNRAEHVTGRSSITIPSKIEQLLQTWENRPVTDILTAILLDKDGKFVEWRRVPNTGMSIKLLKPPPAVTDARSWCREDRLDLSDPITPLVDEYIWVTNFKIPWDEGHRLSFYIHRDGLELSKSRAAMSILINRAISKAIGI